MPWLQGKRSVLVVLLYMQVLYWSLACLTLLAGASSSIGSLGAAVAVEREYAKALCGGDSTALRKLNAGVVPGRQLQEGYGAQSDRTHSHSITHMHTHSHTPCIPRLPVVSPACLTHTCLLHPHATPPHAAPTPTAMRAIDLLSQMLGPVASGLLMSYSSMLAAIVVLSAYSLAAWLPEAWLLQAAHRCSHRLRCV